MLIRIVYCCYICFLVWMKYLSYALGKRECIFFVLFDWPGLGVFFLPPLWLCFVRLYVSRIVFVNDWEIFQSAPILLVIRSILCGWWRHCAAVNFMYIYFAVATFLCRHSFHPQEIRRHRLWWRKLDWTSHIRTIMLTQFPGDGDNQATEDEQQHNEVILIGWRR